MADHVEHHLPEDFQPHESPWQMTLPLVVLAGAALLGGGLNLPFTPDLHFLDHWLEPSLFGAASHPDFSTGEKVFIAVFSVALTLVGLLLAFVVYVQRRVDAAAIEHRAFAEGWWIDSTYARLMGGPGRKLFEAAAWFDRTVIDGAVNGVATGVRLGGTALRTVQTGYVRTYALAIGLGAVFVGAWFLTRASF